jgi:hypothetical protein
LIRAETAKRWHNRFAVSVVVLRLAAVPAAAATVVGAGAGDPGSSRLVYAMVVGLALVGVALIALAAWIIRQTRPDLEVLAPLERMGDGDWRKRDPSTQRRMLDEVRPEGAQPLLSEPLPPPLDADFESDHPVSSFSDLGPGVVSEGGDPTPLHVDADLDADLGIDIGPARTAPQRAEPEANADPEPNANADPDADTHADADEALSDRRG